MKQPLSEVIQQAEELSAVDKRKLIMYLSKQLEIESAQVDVQKARNDSKGSADTTSVTESVLELAAKFAADIPKEELARLPHDGAEQHDHYIYGTPKI